MIRNIITWFAIPMFLFGLFGFIVCLLTQAVVLETKITGAMALIGFLLLIILLTTSRNKTVKKRSYHTSKDGW